jgi:hypothetical protein
MQPHLQTIFAETSRDAAQTCSVGGMLLSYQTNHDLEIQYNPH